MGPSVLWLAGVLAGGGAAPLRAADEPRSFWEQAADPATEEVETLVARARAELDPRVHGGAGPGNAARALPPLEEALAKKPRHFAAALLLAEAYAATKRPGDAIKQLARACDLAATADEERFCALRLGVERSKGGRYDEALADYDRHIRLGQPRAAAYANSAEVLMALGRLDEAEARYRHALVLEAQDPKGRPRIEALALAHFGRAVALDRAGRSAAAREALGSALRLDPRLDLLDATSAEGRDVNFVPPGDVHYYRGLALAQLGRRSEAADAFRRFATESAASRYRGRAEVHLAALEADEKGPAEPAARTHARVVAAATVRTDGPLPAPLVDGVWKRHARDLEPCFAPVPVSRAETVRIAFDVVIAPSGAVEAVTAHLPEGWGAATACLEARVKALRMPRATRKEGRTSARLELVLAIKP